MQCTPTCRDHIDVRRFPANSDSDKAGRNLFRKPPGKDGTWWGNVHIGMVRGDRTGLVYRHRAILFRACKIHWGKYRASIVSSPSASAGKCGCTRGRDLGSGLDLLCCRCLLSPHPNALSCWGHFCETTPSAII